MITLPYFDLTTDMLGEPAPTFNVFGTRRKFGIPDGPSNEQKFKILVATAVALTIILIAKIYVQKHGH